MAQWPARRPSGWYAENFKIRGFRRRCPEPLHRIDSSCCCCDPTAGVVRQSCHPVLASIDRHRFPSGSHAQAAKQRAGLIVPPTVPCTSADKTRFRPKVPTVQIWFQTGVTIAPMRNCAIQPPSVSQNRNGGAAASTFTRATAGAAALLWRAAIASVEVNPQSGIAPRAPSRGDPDLGAVGPRRRMRRRPRQIEAVRGLLRPLTCRAV